MSRVRMPHNNRVSSSAALKTNDMWSKTIGYDPYASGKAEEQQNDDEESSKQAATLLMLAKISNFSGVESRGGCKRCGLLGHMSFQCRNDISGKDPAPADDSSSDSSSDDDEEDRAVVSTQPPTITSKLDDRPATISLDSNKKRSYAAAISTEEERESSKKHTKHKHKHKHHKHRSDKKDKHRRKDSKRGKDKSHKRDS